MSDREHSPKVAALLAYEDDALSPDARRRLEAHLEACEECRRTLAAMRLYDDVASEVRALEPPEPDYSRMELALRREAREAVRRAQGGQAGGGRGALWLGLAFAAAGLLAFAWWQSERSPEVVEMPDLEEREAPSPAPAEAERGRLTGEITLATADVTARAAGELGEVDVGAEVVEGMALETGEAGLAHLWFYEDTGAVVMPDTSVEVAELREGRVGLRLERGTVANEVAHLAEGDRYEIEACGFTARVRGTLFAVVCSAEGAAVTVDEGVVEIVRDGEVVETLEGPAQWSDGDATPVEQASVPAAGALSREARAWPVLRLPAVDWIRHWEVDGARLPPGAFGMRVPPGERQVTGFGDGDRSWRAEVVVGEEGHFIEPEAIRPSAPPVRAGYLDPELIAPVVRQGQRRLQACQEQVDRTTGDTVIGRFTLRVTIGLTGEVRNAQLIPQGEVETPPAFRQCVLSQVRLWSFPPPTGGHVTFEQPLAFGTRPTHRIR